MVAENKSYSYAPDPFEKMPDGSRKLAVANTVYITNSNRDGTAVTEDVFKSRIKEVEDKFLEFFGGYTSANVGKGEYLSKLDHRVITDKIARIVSFTDSENFQSKRGELEGWLLQKKKDWDQEAIAYEFEGDLYYL